MILYLYIYYQWKAALMSEWYQSLHDTFYCEGFRCQARSADGGAALKNICVSFHSTVILSIWHCPYSFLLMFPLILNLLSVSFLSVCICLTLFGALGSHGTKSSQMHLMSIQAINKDTDKMNHLSL